MVVVGPCEDPVNRQGSAKAAIRRPARCRARGMENFSLPGAENLVLFGKFRLRGGDGRMKPLAEVGTQLRADHKQNTRSDKDYPRNYRQDSSLSAHVFDSSIEAGIVTMDDAATVPEPFLETTKPKPYSLRPPRNTISAGECSPID